jgi:hypothetical protein
MNIAPTSIPNQGVYDSECDAGLHQQQLKKKNAMREAGCLQ